MQNIQLKLSTGLNPDVIIIEGHFAPTLDDFLKNMP